MSAVEIPRTAAFHPGENPLNPLQIARRSSSKTCKNVGAASVRQPDGATGACACHENLPKRAANSSRISLALSAANDARSHNNLRTLSSVMTDASPHRARNIEIVTETGLVCPATFPYPFFPNSRRSSKPRADSSLSTAEDGRTRTSRAESKVSFTTARKTMIWQRQLVLPQYVL